MAESGERLRSKASLRIMGDALIPAAITRLLGCEPTAAHVKGETRIGKRTGREYRYHSGQWRLQATERDPENLDAQIAEIFSQVTADPAVWAELAKEFHIDLYCGLFMVNGNEGVTLSAQSLSILGSRGVELSLDIYEGGDDDEGFGSASSSSGLH